MRTDDDRRVLVSALSGIENSGKHNLRNPHWYGVDA
jgi:hypothetical protein